MSGTIDPRTAPRTQASPGATSDAEFKASLYRFADGGIVGLILWVFRRDISDAMGRYLSIAAAVGAWLVALVLLAVANRIGIPFLGQIAGYALLGIPLLTVIAWVTRTQNEALAAEHGRDSEAYDAAIEAAHQKKAQEAMQDDWILDPPWRRTQASQRPKFGQRSRP